MAWFIITHTFSTLLELIGIIRLVLSCIILRERWVCSLGDTIGQELKLGERKRPRVYRGLSLDYGSRRERRVRVLSER